MAWGRVGGARKSSRFPRIWWGKQSGGGPSGVGVCRLRGVACAEGAWPHLMVIWGRSPPSAFSPMRISRMVWDQ